MIRSPKQAVKAAAKAKPRNGQGRLHSPTCRLGLGGAALSYEYSVVEGEVTHRQPLLYLQGTV